MGEREEARDFSLLTSSQEGKKIDLHRGKADKGEKGRVSASVRRRPV